MTDRAPSRAAGAAGTGRPPIRRGRLASRSPPRELTARRLRHVGRLRAAARSRSTWLVFARLTDGVGSFGFLVVAYLAVPGLFAVVTADRIDGLVATRPPGDRGRHDRRRGAAGTAAVAGRLRRRQGPSGAAARLLHRGPARVTPTDARDRGRRRARHRRHPRAGRPGAAAVVPARRGCRGVPQRDPQPLASPGAHLRRRHERAAVDRGRPVHLRHADPARTPEHDALSVTTASWPAWRCPSRCCRPITRTVEVVLRLVPDGLREACLALGASRARTVWSVVFPMARTGMTTAVVLGIARAVGETAPAALHRVRLRPHEPATRSPAPRRACRCSSSGTSASPTQPSIPRLRRRARASMLLVLGPVRPGPLRRARPLAPCTSTLPLAGAQPRRKDLVPTPHRREHPDRRDLSRPTPEEDLEPPAPSSDPPSDRPARRGRRPSSDAPLRPASLVPR